MTDLARTATALRREIFYFFLKSTFAELHGGASPSDAPYLEAMCFALQGAVERDGGRLLVTLPPRHLKSIAAAIALPAWILGRNPAARIMVATYGDELSRDHSDAFRKVIASHWYQALFPEIQIRSSTQTEVRTACGGARRAVTLGGPTTGFGADVIIVDDLMKAQDTRSQARREQVLGYFQDALLSRFNNPKAGSLISIQQRLHEDDLPATLISTGRYTHLNLPAKALAAQSYPLYCDRYWQRRAGEVLDPARLSAADLDRIRAELGSAVFSAQYQQNPVTPEGAVIPVDRLTLVDQPPARDECERVIQSWDTAAKIGPKCDYSVCTTWGYKAGIWYLLDLYRSKLEYPALKSRVLQLRRKWRPDRILIEDSSTGTGLVQQFRADRVDGIRSVKSSGSKLDRLVPQLDMLESDKVQFWQRAPWWEELARELAAFPEGRHDDQVDSLSQFLIWLRGRQGRGFMDTDPATGRRRMLQRR